MARQRMVTRTIEVSTYDVMYVDLTANTIGHAKSTINSADCLSEKQLEKRLQAEIGDIYKVVQFTLISKSERLYGMTEEAFLQYADLLPNRLASED